MYAELVKMGGVESVSPEEAARQRRAGCVTSLRHATVTSESPIILKRQLLALKFVNLEIQHALLLIKSTFFGRVVDFKVDYCDSLVLLRVDSHNRVSFKPRVFEPFTHRNGVIPVKPQYPITRHRHHEGTFHGRSLNRIPEEWKSGARWENMVGMTSKRGNTDDAKFQPVGLAKRRVGDVRVKLTFCMCRVLQSDTHDKFWIFLLAHRVVVSLKHISRQPIYSRLFCGKYCD